jgi:hypothetical protein
MSIFLVLCGQQGLKYETQHNKTKHNTSTDNAERQTLEKVENTSTSGDE